ncbi:hypothetical protein [Herbidospora cretacea]|uniref:hypothetical protein n=1 Tax=Herbidospora cretacea TaxID=28444 RepID=UPI000A92B79B|nr:hypothetical protein [Herbidospora cretacea]
MTETPLSGSNALRLDALSFEQLKNYVWSRHAYAEQMKNLRHPQNRRTRPALLTQRETRAYGPLETFVDGVIVNRIIDTCHRSMKTGRWEPVGS